MSDQGPVYLGYRLGHLKGDGRIFRALVYNKGASVLHMLRRMLGDDVFFRALRRFYAEHRFQKAGTDDLSKAFEQESGQLARDILRWLDLGQDLPTLSASHTTPPDGSRPSPSTSTSPAAHVFDFPVTVSLIYADGSADDVVVTSIRRRSRRSLPLKKRLRSVEVNRDRITPAEGGEELRTAGRGGTSGTRDVRSSFHRLLQINPSHAHRAVPFERLEDEHESRAPVLVEPGEPIAERAAVDLLPAASAPRPRVSRDGVHGVADAHFLAVEQQQDRTPKSRGRARRQARGIAFGRLPARPARHAELTHDQQRRRQSWRRGRAQPRTIRGPSRGGRGRGGLHGSLRRHRASSIELRCEPPAEGGNLCDGSVLSPRNPTRRRQWTKVRVTAMSDSCGRLSRSARLLSRPHFQRLSHGPFRPRVKVRADTGMISETMDTVTLTIDGQQVTVEKGKTVLQAAIEHGVLGPLLLLPPRRSASTAPAASASSRSRRWRSCRPPARRSATDGMVVSTQTPGRRRGARRRVRVPADQPPARLPGLRQGRRVPAPGLLVLASAPARAGWSSRAACSTARA